MKIESHLHCRSAIGYHFVFVTKWRRRILAGKVEAALKRFLSEICPRNGYAMRIAGVDGDHVHVFVSAPPSVAASEIARRLKGAAAREMASAFPWLARKMPKGLWSPSFFIATVGAMSEGAVLRYINAQGRVE